MSPVVSFFTGHRNADGRTLVDILSWSDDDLERHHDVVQWCFPLHEPSAFNPDAPILTPSDHRLISGSEALQQAMRKTFVRWLGFYGFDVGPTATQITPAGDFEAKTVRWNRPLNHNHLRITRIIRSLRLFSLDAESRATHDAFVAFAASGASRISPRTLPYWHAALTGPLFAPIAPAD